VESNSQAVGPVSVSVSHQCAVSVAVPMETRRRQKVNWYRDHIRQFVVPALLISERKGYYSTYQVGDYRIPELDWKWDTEAEAIVKMEIEETKPKLIEEDYRLMLDALNALENRAKGKSVILPGRDVWPIYVLMQKRKVWNDRIYHFPWMSRNGISDPFIVRQRMEDAEISLENLMDNCYLFDTGFAGSIFKGIARAYDISVERLKSGMMSANSYSGQKCIFQGDKYRSQVLNIENKIPKYFASGNSLGKLMLNSRSEIISTARLTYDLWHGICVKKKQEFLVPKPPYWCSIHETYHT